MDWAAIITGALALAGVTYTAWNARQTKADELAVKQREQDRPDWPAFTMALEKRVEKQDKKIDELFTMVGELRTDLDAEQRRSSGLQRKVEKFVTYVGKLIAWAWEVAPNRTPPPPPNDLLEDLADVWRYE